MDNPTLTLTTARLRLRPWRAPDDVDALHAIWGDPEVIWWGPSPSREATEARLADFIARSVAPLGFYAVELEGRVVGNAFLQRASYAAGVDLGYHVARHAWGQGLATELGARLVQRALVELGEKRVLAPVHVHDTRSLRVAEKLGFAPIAGLVHGGLPHLLFEKRADGKGPPPHALVSLLRADTHVAVLDKPSGLVVHRGLAREDDTAVDRLKRVLGGATVQPAHRLDRGTSGCLVFGRDAETARALHAQFEEGHVEKRYLALVRGVPPERVVVDHPVPRAEDGPRVPAITELVRLAVSPTERCSLVEARPKTGRLHQIRRHLKHLSHPIVGDVNYGDGRVNRHFREVFGLHRLALHAAEVTFEHPARRERWSVEAPLPEDLASALRALGLLTPP